MKNTFTVLLAVLALLILNSSFLIHNCMSQWQPDVRLTNAPDTSRFSISNNGKCIVSNGNLVHVIWNDKRDGNFEIYYKRSTNGGLNWEQDVRLTNDPAPSGTASITASGSIVHVVFVDYRTGTYQLYYKRSTNEGISWEAETQLSSSTGNGVSGPSIKALNSFVLISWHDFRNGSSGEIYYKRSTDGGSNWGDDKRLTNDPANSVFSSCGVSGSVVHIAWCDNRDVGYQVFYNRSTDAGVTWGVDTKLTNGSMTGANAVNLSVSGSDEFIVWQDNRDGNNEIYYKYSIDGGVTWDVDTRLTNDPASSTFPSVLISGSNVHIIWQDNRDGNNEIYYKFSTNKGLSWGVDTRLTFDPLASIKPFISISNSVLNVIWCDDRDGNMEIYYKRNPTGNVGIQNINSEIPKEYKLMQNYPNPFNPSTVISFQLLVAGQVSLKVYDALGREVGTIVNQQLNAGSFNVSWDASQYTTGIYFYRLTAGDYTETKKMLLIK
jgi:hypothetical protein